jgi:hypothetical protein
MSKQPIIVDIEVYPNFFVAVFRSIKTGAHRVHYLEDAQEIKKLLLTKTMVGFNSNNYDLPILWRIADGKVTTHEQIKALNDKIINSNMKHWQHNPQIPMHKMSSIDLYEVAPGVQVSLKQYGGRMHSPKMQDLPLEPDTVLTDEQKELITKYCHNDVDVTEQLYRSLGAQLDLRRRMSAEYNTDLMSKSDAQIAEAVFRNKLDNTPKPTIDASLEWQYQPPEWMTNGGIVEGAKFSLNDKLKVIAPKLDKKHIGIGNSVYSFGIGGLHSTEKCAAHHSDNDTVLRDFDVTSYYPGVILGQRLYPEQLGEQFLDVYGSIVNERIRAKRSGNKVVADSLKITINGSFGKFGSKWSFLYSPTLLTQVTLTGQLALLMLIEQLEGMGVPVVSGNTDGIVVKHSADLTNAVDQLVADWEKQTGFEMEETRYESLYSRDVNNYFAVKGSEIKGKGIFATPGLMKNPTNRICFEAITNNALTYQPIEDYICNCTDITKFLTIRRVTGGAVKDDELIGKMIRWYYSTEVEGTINYKKNGNKVPRTDGARPLMDLPAELPTDINYDWYIKEARSTMRDCAYEEQSW